MRPSKQLAQSVLAAACAAFLIGSGSPAVAEIVTTTPSATQPQPGGATSRPNDLTSLSLEDLMNVEVYSASKYTQRVSEVPAAITVISQDDIRRSGFTTIPELLRMVPGLDVAQIDASHWAISSRGFNELYANKLLVMMDGRSVYTPLFSGVYWDTLDYVLPDLDRIEVIRGPGATLWGSNAVDGVINITSKSARDTQGLLVQGLGGNEEQQGAVRFGGKIDDQTYFRVYGKYRRFDDFELANADDAHDGWQDLRSGFRVDRYSGDDLFTVQGDIYNERAGSTINFPVLTPPFVSPKNAESNFSGGNALGRWKHTISPTSDFSFQFYYDRLERLDTQLYYRLDTFDLDAQHRFALGDRQEIIYGGDVRFLMDDITNSVLGTFTPNRRDDYLLSAFIQDDITIVPDRLHAIVGTKLEQNSYSGFEVQPSGRLLFTPNDKNTFWGAISRAVRTPSRWEQDSRLVFNTGPSPAGLPAMSDTIGDPNFTSEKEVAYEIGYRVKPAPTFSVDATGFYNSYDDLRGGTIGTPQFQPTPAPHLFVPIALNNGIYGNTFGAEIAANWNITPQWRVAASYSWLDVQLHHHKGVGNTLETIFEGTSPRNQAQLRSYWDLTKNLEVNAALYYVDDLKTGNIPAYVRVDAGLTWRPRDNLAISFAVQNLFDDRHPEFNSGLFFYQPTEVPRTYYAELTWRY